MEENNRENGMRRMMSRLMMIAISAVMPLAYYFLTGKGVWTLRDIINVALMILGYWIAVFFVASRLVRNRQALNTINLASPLIELPMSADVRAKLSAFAADRHMKLAVAAFEILDQELPRFDQAEELERARRDNEHLRQQAGQGAFLVAVTTEILKRLLLLSGAHQEDRKVWRSHISETAVRIVNDALDHRTTAI
jgi:hypothetical protein